MPSAPKPRPAARRVKAPSKVAPATPTVRSANHAEMSVEDLSGRTGVSVRNIRAYQTAGLLPSPRMQGRLAFYNQGHLGKLELIRDLRLQGFRLEAIKDMLDKAPQGAWSEYSLISELFSTTFFTVETPQRKAIGEMAAHWDTTATPEQKARLAKNGLYRPIGEEEVELLSPALERIGIQLAELQVPLDTVLDLQDTLIQHTRAIAQAYVQHLFLAMAKALTSSASRSRDKTNTDAGAHNDADGRNASQTPQVDPAMIAAIKVLFERLRPLAIGSISAAFPVVLQQEFDRSLHEEEPGTHE